MSAPGVPVAVLLGGPSAEHDVSLVSGRAVAAALAGRGHAVEGWLIDLPGRWWSLPQAALDGALPASAYDDPAELGADGPHRAAAALERLAGRQPAPVVFIALHGPFGEDGTVQALCEAAELVYTGSGVAASALGMDKVLFKRLVAAEGIPVVPWLDVGAGDWAARPPDVQRRLVEFAERLPDARLMVKPARLGSSVGISIVHRPHDPEYLGSALAEAFAHDDLALVEAYLDHPRELEMAVVGNSADDLATYGPGEVFPGHEFYDYVAKYEPGVSQTTDRPDVTPALRAQLHDFAARAFLAIGGSGFARVDFLLAGDTLYLNEINTIPGFTPISLFPVLCRAGGYDFGAISARIVELALERAAARPRRVLTRAALP
ncbi:MAG: D-alanine--D-alanine ligase [Chloroflexota bacterium]|nr:D-alanine--D-alanine ligase [Chloroflexota bacterium]